MNYNQTEQSNGQVMPLLMGFTNPSQIQEEENPIPIIYDPISQTVFDMRTIGTKSLKTFATGGNKTDKKNEIDDSRSVN